MNCYSPNMFKTYQTCPKKYYFMYAAGVNVPRPLTPFEKGKKIHALANYYHRNIKIDKLEAGLSKEEKRLWGLLTENPFFQMECLKSEFAAMTKVNGFWLGGRIDAVVRKENDFYILDYKTGDIPLNPEYDFQTMVYLLEIDSMLKMYNTLSFVYIDLKNTKNYVIRFNEEMKKQYKKIVTEYCTKIERDTHYECTPSACKYCEYIKFCKL